MITDDDNVTSLCTNTPLTSKHCTDQCTTHHREQSDKLSWQYSTHQCYNLQLPLSTNPTMKSKTTDNSTQCTETSTRDTDNSIVCPYVYTKTSSPSEASGRHPCTIPFYTHRLMLLLHEYSGKSMLLLL